MFDAGAVQAHLDIDTSAFDRKLTTAEARVKDFERAKHDIRISAVFDNASLGRARQIFTQLDQQLSREAMQRLRSSPQGSVLGALNALFSPHPVSGGPSPQQSAQQGLLGRIVNAPGGGGAAGSSTSRLLLSQAAGTASSSPVRVRLTNVGELANAISGGDDSSAPTPTTDPSVARAAEAAVRAAKASQSASEDAAKAARDNSASSRSLFSSLHGLFGGGGGGGTGSFLGGLFGGDAGATKTAKNLGKGIGPGILGLSTKVAGIAGLGASALGALPALAAVGGAAGIAGIGAGVIGIGAKTLIGTANQKGKPATQGPLFDQAKQVAATGKDVLASAAGAMLQPLKTAFSQIPGLLKGILPDLKAVFGGAGSLINPLLHGVDDLAKDVLPGLAAALKAAAPLIRPLIDGLGGLLKGILPGLTALLRAAAPAIAAFGSGLSGIGKDIGKMLSDFAPVISQSSVILKALFGVIGALLPAVGQLAAIFAQTLAPIFVDFAGVVKSLIPFITIIGKVMAQLASAVLGDLVAAFGALASLLKAISPALTVFAKAFGNIFTVLENSGVFAIIGDALEALVKPLASLINALLKGLTPILPVVIKFLADLSAILVAQLVRALTAVLPPLTQLATVVLMAIAQILPIILPLLTGFISVFTGAVADTIVAIADGLNSLLKAIPPSVLKYITIGILAIVGALKLWAIAQAVMDALLSANPLGLIVLAIAALAIGIVELAKHWGTVWGGIRSVFNVVSHFIGERMDAMREAIVGDAQSMWQHLTSWGSDIRNLFTRTIPGWWNEFIGFTKRNLVNPLKSDADDMWHHLQSFGGWIAGLFTRTIPGYWRDFLSLTSRYLVQPIEHAFDSVWSHIQTWGSRLKGFITQTVPGWFNTAVNSISRFWGKIEGVIKKPVAFVIDDVLDGLIRVFDDITSAVGLGKPIKEVHPFGLAQGGRLPGFGGGDRLPALLEPGETVIDKHRTQQYAWLFKMMGVKGFAQGGIPGGANAIHLGTTATPTGGNPLSGILGKAGDIAKIVLDLGHGDTAAAGRAFMSLIGHSGSGGLGGVLGSALKAMPGKLISDAVSWLVGQGAGGSSGGGVGPGVPGPGGGSAAANAALARRLMPAWGSGAMWSAWNALEMSEAGWNQFARNPSSGAYGIPQALPPSKMGAAANPPQSNVTAQIRWMISYIKSVYGNPIVADAHENSAHWYGNGGMITEPIIGFGASGQQYRFGEKGNEWVTPFTGPPGTGGGPGGSKLAEVLNIMLPEGSTVAQAMSELTLRLAIARQQGYLGVGPG